jgi:hypothetical protein
MCLQSERRGASSRRPSGGGSADDAAGSGGSRPGGEETIAGFGFNSFPLCHAKLAALYHVGAVGR